MMSFAMLIPIVAILLPLAIVFLVFFFITIWKLMDRGGKQQGKQVRAEEAQMIQEMYEGLADMAKRVESLEAILLETAPKKESPRHG